MKSLFLTIELSNMKTILILMLFITTITNAQEYKLEEKTVTGIFEVKEKTKSEIFASINKWISINYNSAKNVVQMNDLESGTIIIKGINGVAYKSYAKEVYPNIKFPEYQEIKFNHLIEINIKDNKFRIIYKIIDAATGYEASNIVPINFNGINDVAIAEYNNKMDELLKGLLIGKKKQEKMKSYTKPMFEGLNNNLIENMKSTMQSIEKSITETAKEKW